MILDLNVILETKLIILRTFSECDHFPLKPTQTLIHAFIIRRIDYCDALLSCLPQKNIADFKMKLSEARIRESAPILKSVLLPEELCM